MKKKKVVHKYKRYSASKLHDFGKNVREKMTDNDSFPNPDIPLTELDTALENLRVKIVAAFEGGKQKTAELLRAKNEVNDLLFTEGLYVDRIARGNMALILSSGFNCTKDNSLISIPEFMAKHGNFPGEAVLRCRSVKGAGSYIWSMNTGNDILDEESWKVVGYSRKVKATITNLESGKRVWFRFCAVKYDDLTPWCDPIQIMII